MQVSIPVTILDFLNYSDTLLKQNEINDARLNAEFMLCNVLGCDRISLYLNYDKPLSKDEIEAFNKYLSKRLKYEPLQYILGKANFYGLDFIVNNKVLIPRPETELIVERVIKHIDDFHAKKISIFEIGSGSGCISISIAKDLEARKIEYDIFSIDSSSDAIKVANENLKLNNLDEKRIRFYEKNVFEIKKLNKSFDYIVSNPPYISLEDYRKLSVEVRDYEPAAALTDDGNGLKFFAKIFQISRDSSFTGKIFCEIGYGQKNEIELLLKDNKLECHTFHKDYNGIYRILEV